MLKLRQLKSSGSRVVNLPGCRNANTWGLPCPLALHAGFFSGVLLSQSVKTWQHMKVWDLFGSDASERGDPSDENDGFLAGYVRKHLRYMQVITGLVDIPRSCYAR